ncbi:MAG TPA: hypothetical protein VH561_17065 [Micromonosporaceae bacterium]
MSQPPEADPDNATAGESPTGEPTTTRWTRPYEPSAGPWTPPGPLSFGPPEPPPGPIVSPSIAAYQPVAPLAPPSYEPPTGPIELTPPPVPVAPSPPVTAAPTPAYPVPTPPAPASFHPPPVPSYPTPQPYPPPQPYLPAVTYPPVHGYPPGQGYYPPGQAYPPVGYLAAGVPAYDPATGAPLSDKSRQTAGLLQLLLGLFLSLGGVGRLYAGNMPIGVTQLVLTAVAWVSFWCGFGLFPVWIVFLGLWVWFWVDGIVMLVGRPVDGQGRLLR